MKTKYLSIISAISLAITGIILSGCNKEDEPLPGDLYFNIENMDNLVLPQEGVDVTTFSKGKKFIVRSNGNWQFVPEDEAAMAWAKVFPMEGDADGMIRIYSEENLSPVQRVARYKVFLNGVEQPQMLTFSQKGCEPFLKLSTALVTLKRAGGEVSITVDANLDWECSVEGTDASRFTATAVSPQEIKVSTDRINDTGNDIMATLVVSGKGEFSNIRQLVAIEQLYATFFDDFSWLPNPKAGILGWNAHGSELGMSSWTDEQIAHGWTSISTWFYYRDKFVKFGKGGYGGDACSPAVPELGNNANATISWSALGYGTTKNVKEDHNMFYVAILGPGKIVDCSSQGEMGYTMGYRDDNGKNVTLDAVKFTFDDNAWMIPALDSTATVIWQTPSAQFSINVQGMDGTSRVVFVAGPGTLDNLYQEPNGKQSRMFMDNFKIVEN